MLRIHRLRSFYYLGLIAAFFTLLEPSVFAQEKPQFLIETITVENADQFSPSIVVAESLLKEDHAYSEAELRDAIHRIIRLPLILDASFNLLKGTRRDHYELVITVEEVRRWFFGEIGEFTWGDSVIYQNSSFPGRDTAPRLLEDDELSHLVGHRSAIGAYGVLSASVEPSSRGKLQLGYTQYNLFERNIQLKLQYLLEPLVQRSNEDTEVQTTRIELGVPLWGNHSLWVRSSFQNLETQSSYSIFENRVDRERLEEQWSHNVSWVFNTLDDPVFPSSGSFFRTGLDHTRTDSVDIHSQSSDDLDDFVRTVSAWKEFSTFVSADHFWSLNKKDSISLSLDFASVRRSPVPSTDFEGNTFEADFDEWDGRLALGYSRFLYRDTKKPRWRELRWENSLNYRRRDSRSPFNNPWTVDEYRISSGLKYRTSWGVFGLTFNYLERPGEL